MSHFQRWLAVRAKLVCVRCADRHFTDFIRGISLFGGMYVAEAKQLKEQESENAKLTRMLAEQLLAIDGLKEFTGKEHPRQVAGLLCEPWLAGASSSAVPARFWA